MPNDLLARRMENLGLARPAMPGPAETLAHLLAVQSQDYGPAKWSLGQRARVAEPAVEAAFAAGAILRTHVLRPTWHFVSPADLRWLLRLTGPRVHIQNANYYRTTGLDEATLSEATRLIVAELEGGNHLTRRSLVAGLAAAGIPTEGFAAAYTFMHAELEGIICSGPLDGRQHTYALLEERVPPVPALGADEALAELVLRYFTSRGPATVKDLRWWSSVTLTAPSSAAKRMPRPLVPPPSSPRLLRRENTGPVTACGGSELLGSEAAASRVAGRSGGRTETVRNGGGHRRLPARWCRVRPRRRLGG